MEAKVINNEAYVSTMYLYINFEYNNKKYYAKGYYFNGDSITDIDVMDEKDNYLEEEDEVYMIGKELLEDMDFEKHLTF
jgi:hypothetical protein